MLINNRIKKSEILLIDSLVDLKEIMNIFAINIRYRIKFMII